jgi:hypothetical protein
LLSSNRAQHEDEEVAAALEAVEEAAQACHLVVVVVDHISRLPFAFNPTQKTARLFSQISVHNDVIVKTY